MALGFPRHQVIEAYFACDKNEGKVSTTEIIERYWRIIVLKIELAANYLFEHSFGDDEE